MKHCISTLAMLLMGVVSLFAANPSNTLPVLHIDIENGAEVVTKDPYLNATYWLDPMGVDGIEAFGTQAEPLVLKIKGRGNYTFTGFDKKPYRLKLDAKADLCGMKKSKHFGLLAHADDSKGFLRNTIGFKVSEIVGLPWTPDMYPVEVVINGSYRGLYFLTELIRIDKDRVNITAWTDEDELGNPLEKWIEGGTLVEIDNYDEEAQIQFNNGKPDILRFTYDKSVDPGFEPDGYIDWLKSSLGQVNNLILNGDRNSDDLWDLVDIDDLARFIVVQEFTDNYESFHGSCYLFREKGEGEKWHFSPVWDFGSAFQRNHPNTPFYEIGNGNMHYNHWVGELLQRPALRAKVAEYWALLKSKRAELDDYAASFINQITSAAACDKQRWPQYGNDNLQGKLSEVKGYLNSSQSYLNNEYGSDDPSEKDFYLVGEFNNWNLSDASYKFSLKSGNTYTYKASAAIEGGWKINDGSWTDDWGYNSSSQPELNKEYSLGHSTGEQGNLTTAIPAGATVEFTYVSGGEGCKLRIITEGGDEPDPVNPEDMTLYLVGGFNGWALADTNYKMKNEGNGNYSFFTASGIAAGWKINNGTWDEVHDWGQNGETAPKLNEEFTPLVKGGNINLAVPANGTVRFHYDATNPTMVIEGEGGEQSEYEHTFLFLDSHNDKWETVHLYLWIGSNEVLGGWPGKAMTKVENPSAVSRRAPLEGNLWSHTFTTDYPLDGAQLIFHNNNGTKTDDLDMDGYGYVRNESGGITTGISDVKTNITDAVSRVSGSHGIAVIEASETAVITVCDSMGKTRNVTVGNGTNFLHLGSGLWFVAGRKIVL